MLRQYPFSQKCGTMEVTAEAVASPAPKNDWLTQVLRQGIEEMPAQAIGIDVPEWGDVRSQTHDEQGQRRVVHSGYLPARKTVMGQGKSGVCHARVHNDRPERSENP